MGSRWRSWRRRMGRRCTSTRRRQIRHRFGLFQEAFAGREATVCYAVKANSSLAILRLLAELGAGFDIVSGGELERVRRADKAALKRVVFSGAGKQVWEIDAALKAGILLFNVESEAELELLAERAEALGVRARFALRVNPDVFAETHPYISTGLGSHKFGVEIGLARAIYRRAARSHVAGCGGSERSHRVADPLGRAVCRGAGARGGAGRRTARRWARDSLCGCGRRIGDRL